MVKAYIPDRGDIVMMTFNPQAGREQAGMRPALVLSPLFYNERSGLMIACPITSRKKGYPFEVLLPENLTTHGVVLADHLKSVDWHARQVRFVERASASTLQDVTGKISVLLKE